MPELENMSIDELTEYKQQRKAEIEAIKADSAIAHSIQLDKIDQAFIDEARLQVETAAEAEGKTPEEIADSWIKSDFRDPGKAVNALRFKYNRVVNAYAIPLYVAMEEEGKTDIEAFATVIAYTKPETTLGEIANDWLRRTEARNGYRL